MITEEELIQRGYEKLNFCCKTEYICDEPRRHHLSRNEFDDTLIYDDNRNKIYGIETIEELEWILVFSSKGLKWRGDYSY